MAQQDKPTPAGGGEGKGMWKMAICCGGPLLAIALLSGLGISVGSLLGAALPLLLALACPLGMGLMMWSMMRKQRSSAQATPPASGQVAEGEVIEVKPVRARPELTGPGDGQGASPVLSAASGVGVPIPVQGGGDGSPRESGASEKTAVGGQGLR